MNDQIPPPEERPASYHIDSIAVLLDNASEHIVALQRQTVSPARRGQLQAMLNSLANVMQSLNP